MFWTRRSAFALIAAATFGIHPALAMGPPRRGAPDDDEPNETIPNMFISPCGQPFRAPIGAPYPKADWFQAADKNGDGKLDHDEFVADADAFFKRLDLNGDGALSRYEIHVYEKMVPEILGGPVMLVGQNGGARLWLAQYGPPGGMGGSGASIDPQGDHPDASVPARPKPLDESGQGAAPYSFFEEPEPVMTADLEVNGIILRDNFLKVADMHFTALDTEQKGYLTLKGLPKTPVEKLLTRGRHGRNRS